MFNILWLSLEEERFYFRACNKGDEMKLEKDETIVYIDDVFSMPTKAEEKRLKKQLALLKKLKKKGDVVQFIFAGDRMEPEILGPVEKEHHDKKRIT